MVLASQRHRCRAQSYNSGATKWRTIIGSSALKSTVDLPQLVSRKLSQSGEVHAKAVKRARNIATALSGVNVRAVTVVLTP